uniref:Uncharacterized protein n=1 Tax=Timema tahoe TaxID=61484 RepID=A0A7R9FL83_9NEOP|nr:unnamed protein product [Timema tahoe]
MNENDYRFGVTRVFFRPGKYAEFDAIMKSDPDNLAAMVAKVKKWLIASRWKKAQWCSLSVIKLKNKMLYRKAALVVIQRNVRMHLAQRQHRPRYQGISKIKGLQERLTRMSAIVNQLKKDKESSVSEVQKLQADMTASILKIKRKGVGYGKEQVKQDENDVKDQLVTAKKTCQGVERGSCDSTANLGEGDMKITDVVLHFYPKLEENLQLSRLKEHHNLNLALRHLVRKSHEKGTPATYVGRAGASSNINVTLCNVEARELIGNWQVHDCETSSDHNLITFELGKEVDRENVGTRLLYNLKKADWERLGRELVLPQPVSQEDNINLKGKELAWALQAATRKTIPAMKEVPRCITAGKIRPPAVISTLKTPAGGMATCWEESARLLLMVVLLPDDNPEERDEENERDRQDMIMTYNNENVIVEPATQDEIKGLIAAPIALSSAWTTPPFMFSKLSVTSSPLYSAPMKTPLSIGSLGSHYSSRSPAPMGNSLFAHWTRSGSSGGYSSRAILFNPLSLPTVTLPPTATHVARTSFCSTATHVARTSFCSTVTHVSGTSFCSTVTHVSGTSFCSTKKLQQQKSAEEQQRLRKIQEEMEREKKLKEEEERRKKEEEETRRLCGTLLFYFWKRGRQRWNVVSSLLHAPSPPSLIHASLFTPIDNWEEVTPSPAISYVDLVSVDADVVVYGEVTDADIIVEVLNNNIQSEDGTSGDEEENSSVVRERPIQSATEAMNHKIQEPRKAEMEIRRKAEEEERKRQEEADKRTAAALQAQLEKEALEDTRYREQLEQERRDHELALRLAQETNGQVEDMNHEDSMRCIKDALFRCFPDCCQSCKPFRSHGLNRFWSDCYELCRHVEAVIVSAPPNVFSACFHGDTVSRTVNTEVRTATPAKLNRSELARSVQAAQGKQKHDLSKWKYSELRDTINTSCDIELLEACRIEFHRRLKVYHAWKAKNKRRTIMDENERAPRSVMDAAAKVRTPRAQVKQPINNNSQRYFRIPFIRPSVAIGPQGDANNKRGWWYAHFDGEFVARQMELHPDKPPILLVAGTDDMQMCELSLDETGLTRKRGAEILEHEFNREWEKNSGKAYLRPADRTK